MPDPVIAPVTPAPTPVATVAAPAPVPTPSAAPPSPPPESAPAVVEAQPPPTPVESPKAEVPTEITPAVVEPPPSLLAEAGKEPAANAVTEPASTASATVIAYDFKFPEHFQPDTKGMEAFTGILSEAKAPQELGQKIMDLYVKEVAKFQEAQIRAFTETTNNWKEDVLADPELGGNRIQTVLKTCGSVMEQFGTPELRSVMNLTGVGNHPEMVRFLNKIGKFLGEGKPVRAEKPVAATPPTRSQRRYGNGANA